MTPADERMTSLRPREKVSVVLVPWLFLFLFAALYVLFVLPRMYEGAWAALCLGAFVALVFVSFCVAAVTFSRDVLSGRWPG
jgi:hypothetical protein